MPYVTVQDIMSPVITLVGSNPQTIVSNDQYEELGATAADNCDGDLSRYIVIVTGAVDTSTPGDYEVTYDVKDSLNNDAVQMIRDVTVTNDAPVAICQDNMHPVEAGCAWTPSPEDVNDESYDPDGGGVTLA